MGQREFEIIDEIRRSTARRAGVDVGIGDDAAVLAATSMPTLVTCDMLLEGIHFDRTSATPRQIGRKAMAVNLSDIAAMAGRPTAAVVAVGLPADAPRALAAELHQGIAEIASEFDVALIGGDTNRSNGGLVVCVTLLGVPTGCGPVLRSGARVGDTLCVTGSLGGSILGKHLMFTPRVGEAAWLHQNCSLHAMMDVSDGLGGDLHHILNESDVGAVLYARAIPISDAALQLANGDRQAALDRALDDGEDFELLFALPADEADRLVASQPLIQDWGVAIHRIGEITQDRGAFLDFGDRIEPLVRRGFVHAV